MNKDEFLYSKIAKGDEQAFQFIIKWLQHINNVDDCVDEKMCSEDIVKCFVRATELFGTDLFYNKYCNILFPINVLAANAFTDSVLLQASTEQWKQNVGDVLRSYGNEMLLMVAYIMGGWDHMRACSMEIRELSYEVHHDALGKAI